MNVIEKSAITMNGVCVFLKLAFGDGTNADACIC